MVKNAAKNDSTSSVGPFLGPRFAPHRYFRVQRMGVYHLSNLLKCKQFLAIEVWVNIGPSSNVYVESYDCTFFPCIIDESFVGHLWKCFWLARTNLWWVAREECILEFNGFILEFRSPIFCPILYKFYFSLLWCADFWFRGKRRVVFANVHYGAKSVGS